MKPAPAAKCASTVLTTHAPKDREGRPGGLVRSAVAKACGYSFPQFHQGPMQSSALQGTLSLPWARASSLPSISRSVCEAILPPLCSCSSLFLNTSAKWVQLEPALPTFIKAIHSSASLFSFTLRSINNKSFVMPSACWSHRRNLSLNICIG